MSQSSANKTLGDAVSTAERLAASERSVRPLFFTPETLPKSMKAAANAIAMLDLIIFLYIIMSSLGFKMQPAYNFFRLASIALLQKCDSTVRKNST